MGYAEDAKETVGNIRYDETVLSASGVEFTLSPRWMPWVRQWSPVYADMLQPFSFDRYLYPRLPVDLGPVNLDVVKDTPRVLRCTVKPQGSLTVSVPDELVPLLPLLDKFLHYELMVNPSLVDCDVHVTTDYGVVEEGQTQRFPGWHADGLQGGKFKEKLMCEHSYISASAAGTDVALQPFFVKHLDEDVYNMFKAFDQQVKISNVVRTLPSHMYLFDPYMVHHTPVMEERAERCFIRITVANNPLPIEFNTMNPMLGQVKYPYKYDIRDHVVAPDVPVMWEMYGLAKVQPFQDAVIVEKGEGNEGKKIKQDTGVFPDPGLTAGESVLIPERVFPVVQPLNPLYADMVEPFDAWKYTTVHPPIHMGKVNAEEVQKCPNVLRLLVKWYGEEEMQLPAEFLPLKSLLVRLLTYDRMVNPLWREFAAHVTLDTRVVEAGKSQRFPGFHGDDLQGGAFPRKVVSAHSYIFTTAPVTEVCLQPFFVAHVDDECERVFDEFDRQAREENVFLLKPSHVYLIDPYSVHRSPEVTEVDAGSLRTFFRLTMSPVDLLLPHNTLNPMFADRENGYAGHTARHTDETRFTVTSDSAIPYSFYGLDSL